MGKSREEELGHGDDSFLDIVANLVGVMIILIVVMGVRSQVSAKATIDEAAGEEFAAQLEKPTEQVNLIQSDLIRQSQELERYALEVNLRRSERDQLLNRINAIKMALEEELAKEGESERERILSLQTVSELERELAALMQQQGDSTEKESPTIVLQHLPTPMAKTVFNKEVHLMMRGGAISVIPWDRLVEALKKQFELSVRRNSRKEVIDEQLGPIGGFRMEYRLISKKGLVSNGSAAGMGQMIALDRFELVPTEEVVLESFDEAFADGGRLRMELAGRNPRETVMTVWVYPDSFVQFRQLKEQLFSMGYLTAARPLPEGIRIGAAPTGSHSSAQ